MEIYRGSDADQVFVSRIENDLGCLYNTYLKEIMPMNPLTPNEQLEFESAQTCCICEHILR